MSVRISIIMNDDHYSSDKLNSELYCSGLLAPSAGFTYLDNKVLSQSETSDPKLYE